MSGGYFGDFPFIPLMEVSALLDEIKASHVHPLAPHGMYPCDSPSFFSASSSPASSASTSTSPGTSNSQPLLLLPVPLIESTTALASSSSSFSSHAAALLPPDSAPSVFRTVHSFPVSILSMPLRCPDRIRDVVLHKVAGVTSLHVLDLIPAAAAAAAFESSSVASSLVSLLTEGWDAVARFLETTSVQERPADEAPSLLLLLVPNVDLVVKDAIHPSLPLLLSLFLHSLASLLQRQQHSSLASRSDVRVVFTVLDDAQGEVVADMLCHCLVTLGISPGWYAFDSASASSGVSPVVPTLSQSLVDENATLFDGGVECCPLPVVVSGDDQSPQLTTAAEDGAGTTQQTMSFQNLLESVGQHLVLLHEDLCAKMEDGEISATESPVVLVLLDAASSQWEPLRQQVLTHYVSDPVRMILSVSEIAAMELPLVGSPLFVGVPLGDVPQLRRLLQVLAAKGFSVQAMVSLGGTSSSSSSSSLQPYASPYLPTSWGTLRSQLLWLEEFMKQQVEYRGSGDGSLIRWYCPQVAERPRLRTATTSSSSLLAECFAWTFSSSQSLALFNAASNAHGSQWASVLADLSSPVAVYMLWLYRRMASSSSSSSNTAAGTVAALNPAHSSSSSSLTAEERHAEEMERKEAAVMPTLHWTHRLVPCLRASVALKALWDAAVRTLRMSGSCTLPHKGTTTATKMTTMDATHHDTLQQQATVLRLTPFGRFLTEDWKFKRSHRQKDTPSPPSFASSNIFRNPSTCFVAARLLIGCATLRLSFARTRACLEDTLEVPLKAEDADPIIAGFAARRGIRFVAEGGGGSADVAPQVLGVLQLFLRRWSSASTLTSISSFDGKTANANRTSTNDHLSRLDRILTAAAGVRTKLDDDDRGVGISKDRIRKRAATVVCRGWFDAAKIHDDTTASGLDAYGEENGDAARLFAFSDPSAVVPADAVPTYHFPPREDSCAMKVLSEGNTMTTVAEMPIELSETILAVRLLLGRMIENNIVLSQTQPSVALLPPAATSQVSLEEVTGRTAYASLRIVTNPTVMTMLQPVPEPQHRSGMWVDSRLSLRTTAVPTNPSLRDPHSRKVPSLVHLCDHQLFRARKVRRLEALAAAEAKRVAEETAIFDGLEPTALEKKTIDMFITTAIKLGRSETEKKYLGKKGFHFLTPGHPSHAYYQFYVAKESRAAGK